jgi:hypothetical protein
MSRLTKSHISKTTNNLRDSILNLGHVSYDDQNSTIKVGHPLYDIKLIDERNQVWQDYVSKRLQTDSAAPYKNDLKP